MKKIMLFVLTFAMLFAVFGCADNGIPWTEEEPAYTSDREFMIGMWVGVPNSIREYDPDTGEVIEGSEKRISDEDFLQYYRDIEQ